MIKESQLGGIKMNLKNRLNDLSCSELDEIALDIMRVGLLEMRENNSEDLIVKLTADAMHNLPPYIHRREEDPYFLNKDGYIKEIINAVEILINNKYNATALEKYRSKLDLSFKYQQWRLEGNLELLN